MAVMGWNGLLSTALETSYEAGIKKIIHISLQVNVYFVASLQLVSLDQDQA